MKNNMHFGMSMPICRTDSGALSSREIEKISDFLRRRGLLITEYLDSCIVLVHPDLVEKVRSSLLGIGLQAIWIGSTLAGIRHVESISLAENRVLELLSPGPIVLAKETNEDSSQQFITIPDSFDLRDISCIYNGVMQAFIWLGEDGQRRLEEKLCELDLRECGIGQMGILESPMYEDVVQDKISIARVKSPGDVKCIIEGTFEYELIKDASNNISLWEIGEWT